MTKILFTPPGRDEPGYLRRMKRTLELQSLMNSTDIKPEHIDLIVEFMLPYVTEPVDREAAREALWDGSQEDFDRMLKAVSGDMSAENPTKESASESTGS